MKGRTVFVIAHRLSTVRNSDAIMVLDHGRIIERGGRADLIAQRGTYYRLYTGAFELGSQGAVIRNLNRRLWHCRADSVFG